MSVEHKSESDREQKTGQFHYNSHYEIRNGCGFMRRVITYQDIPASGELQIPLGAIITDSAREAAAARGIKIIEVREDRLPPQPPSNTVAIGADHGGFRLKEQL